VYVVPNIYHTLTHLLLLPKYIAYNFWPKLNLINLTKYQIYIFHGNSQYKLNY
jgi:hypothetical protein